MSLATSQTVQRGNTIRTTLTVLDEDGVLVDPSSLVLTVKNSSGVSVTYAHPDAFITNDSVGVFHAVILFSLIGVWEYQWTTTEPDKTIGEEIYVEADPISSAPLMASVADYVRMYLGAQTWDLLTGVEQQVSYGAGTVTLAIETVKRRVMTNPPITPLESTLNPLVLDYLGILSALQLIPAAKDAWGSKIISSSVGHDPSEIKTYTDRAKLIEAIQDDLLRRLPAIQAIAAPHIDTPTPTANRSQPATDELYDERVTVDPRTFPPASTYPDYDPARMSHR